MDDLKRAMDLWMSLPEPPWGGEGIVFQRVIQQTHDPEGYDVGFMVCTGGPGNRWYFWHGGPIGWGKTLLIACEMAWRHSQQKPEPPTLR